MENKDVTENLHKKLVFKSLALEANNCQQRCSNAIPVKHENIMFIIIHVK